MVRSFEAWYGGFHARLVAALVVIAGDPDRARDAADEALVRALERWNRVERTASPEAWTYRVAVNVLRRSGRRAATEQRLLHRLAVSEAAVPDLRPDVWEAVTKLARREREAIALRYVLDLSEAQVAKAMGVAVGTASATLTSARQKLAASLGEDESVGAM